MWKLRMCVFAATGMLALGTGTAALAQGNPHGGGNPNAASNSNGSDGSSGGSQGNANGQGNGNAQGNSNAGGQSSSGANGDSNAGDVWLDSSTTAGPGHEMDPHLGCPQTIYMYGANMADSSGTYTING